MLRRLSCFLALAGLLAGCNGSNNQTNLNPLVPIITPLHLYVADAVGSAIAVYNIPIANTSTPAYTITGSNGPSALAVDPLGNLATMSSSVFPTQTITYYTAPLGASSTPAATWSNGTPALTAPAIAFLNANNTSALFASNSTAVNRYNAPFSNSSTPAATTSNGLTTPAGVAFDSSNNLYVANYVQNAAGTSSNIKVYASPYTGAATVTTPLLSNTRYRKIAIFSTVLVVANIGAGGAATGQLDVYNLPLTNTSLPAFSITTGVNVPESPAFDAGGTLYLGNLGNSTVTEYAQPLSSTSSPIVTLTVAGGTNNIFAIAVGP